MAQHSCATSGLTSTRVATSGSFQPGERDDDGVWETEDYASADYKIDLTIDQGSGSIRIH